MSRSSGLPWIALALLAAACGNEDATSSTFDSGGLDAGTRADAGPRPDDRAPDAGQGPDAGSDVGFRVPDLVPVVGNFDPSTITSFTRVSFVLQDGVYRYFRVMGGETFVSAVTSRHAVGRFVNASGTLDSFVLDLATDEARVFRLPDATNVWITDANEAGVVVGTAERVRPGATEPSTFAFRHDLRTGTTRETFVGDFSGYLALREDGAALLHIVVGDELRQYIEDASGESRVELERRGFSESFFYLGLTEEGDVFGLRSFDARGGVISTPTPAGLIHRFVDIESPSGQLYATTIFSIDHDGTMLVRYEVPGEAEGAISYRYGLLASLEAEPTTPPPAHPIFLNAAIAEVQYGGLRWGRIWGVATYYGE